MYIQQRANSVAVTARGILSSVEIKQFHENVSRGQRIGQALMNALSPIDCQRIVDTGRDCFHAERDVDVYNTLLVIGEMRTAVSA